MSKIPIYRSVHFITFSCSHQCLVNLPELEPISPKGKRDIFSCTLTKRAGKGTIDSTFCLLFFEKRKKMKEKLILMQ